MRNYSRNQEKKELNARKAIATIATQIIYLQIKF